ncbi:MAG: LCP family protein [Oscillospiraceae bacterium]|nr:LCP family protein [Oscillospiraceae bacterium]
MKKGYWTKRDLKRENARQFRAFALVFAVLILLSAVTMTGIYIKKKITLAYLRSVVTSETETEKNTAAEPDLEGFTGSAGFMLALMSDEGKVCFVVTALADLDKRLIALTPIPGDATLAANGFTGDISSQYEFGGLTQLMAAVSGICPYKLDRYVSIAERNFIALAKLMGDVTVYVKNDISYDEQNIGLHLKAGRQNLNSVTLLYYIRYGAAGEGLAELQCETLCDIFGAYVTAKNIDKGETLFSRLINLTDSNISAHDYVNALPVIKMLPIAKMTYVTAAYEELNFK